MIVPHIHYSLFTITHPPREYCTPIDTSGCCIPYNIHYSEYCTPYILYPHGYQSINQSIKCLFLCHLHVSTIHFDFFLQTCFGIILARFCRRFFHFPKTVKCRMAIAHFYFYFYFFLFMTINLMHQHRSIEIAI